MNKENYNSIKRLQYDSYIILERSVLRAVDLCSRHALLSLLYRSFTVVFRKNLIFPDIVLMSFHYCEEDLFHFRLLLNLYKRFNIRNNAPGSNISTDQLLERFCNKYDKSDNRPILRTALSD